MILHVSSGFAAMVTMLFLSQMAFAEKHPILQVNQEIPEYDRIVYHPEMKFLLGSTSLVQIEKKESHYVLTTRYADRKTREDGVVIQSEIECKTVVEVMTDQSLNAKSVKFLEPACKLTPWVEVDEA